MTPGELRAARIGLNLSQSQLADALQLNNNGARLVRRWELGEIPISGPAATAVELLLLLSATRSREMIVDRPAPAPELVEFVKALARANAARDYRKAVEAAIAAKDGNGA